MSASKTNKAPTLPQKGPRSSRADELLERLRRLFADSDLRSARKLAFALIKSDELTEAQKREARRFLEQTEIDQQAMWVGAFALLLAILYLAFFIL